MKPVMKQVNIQVLLEVIHQVKDQVGGLQVIHRVNDLVLESDQVWDRIGAPVIWQIEGQGWQRWQSQIWEIIDGIG